MAGQLPPDVFETLRDENGRPLSQTLIQMWGNPSAIHEARRSGSTVHTFPEPHIEQGPVLASEGIDIGIVTGITGIHRGSVEVLGRPDHGGTTPMDRRKDALSASSEAVLALERICGQIQGLVGTVGKIEVHPNAPNVVPGSVRMDFEMRSFRKESIQDAMDRFATSLKEIGCSRNIDMRMESRPVSRQIEFDPGVIQKISTCAIGCQESGIRRSQVSGVRCQEDRSDCPSFPRTRESTGGSTSLDFRVRGNDDLSDT